MTHWEPIWRTLLRLALVVVVAAALPFAFDRWGSDGSLNGQSAFAALIFCTLLGGVAGVIYFVLCSLAAYVLRNRPARYRQSIDLGAFVLCTAFLLFAGATPEYADTGMPAAELDETALQEF